VASISPKKRRVRGLQGAALLNAFQVHTRNGAKNKNIWKACGYNSESLFELELAAARLERLNRLNQLQRMHSQDLGTSEASTEAMRQRAQRRLVDGKELTIDEVAALPDFQRRALAKSLEPLPRGRAKKKKRKDAIVTNGQTHPIRVGRPPRLIGAELLETALRLETKGVAEINIAIKCGYGSGGIGPFRRALSRAVGCEIAPMNRILLLYRGENK
jgi:hypothetical protein